MSCKAPPDFDVTLHFPLIWLLLSYKSLDFLCLIITFSDSGDDSGSCLLLS
jgi:hypothetical protein